MKGGTMVLVALMVFGVMAACGQDMRTVSKPAAKESGATVIAQDSLGMQVIVKEKYGSYVLDTCTVVMLFSNNFVLVHRATPSGWYPTSFHSVRVLRKFSEAQSDSTGTPDADGEERDVIAQGTLSIGAVVEAMAYAQELYGSQ